MGIAGTALAVPLAAQPASQRAIPSTYAITNARLVPVSGPVVEKGTIVVRDGLIAAIGATVKVPADARVVDGAGLTVYPGLIDAFSSLGIASAQGAGGRGGAGGGGAVAALAAFGGGQGGPNANASTRNASHPPGLQPEVTAMEQLRADGEAFAGPQSAGITAALTAPASGIFQGQSAFVNLGSGDAAALVIKSPVSQNVGFTPLRNGGYPNSLLGVWSSLRQMLLDAQHYRDEQSAYAKSPRGMRRPEYDASLEALQPVLSGQQPVIMSASTKREIERALDFAKEFKLKAIIAGGSEAYEVADRLKADGVPVLLSINFPRRTAAPTADADPDPIRLLRDRVQAPKTPSDLAKAGVKFAFESGGMTTWADFLGNAQKSVESGLPADQALRAMTLGSAEILGVADRVGSLEVGKIANLTIARGDLLGRGGRVTQLFVDGKPVTVRPPAAADANAVTATGAWTTNVSLDNAQYAVTFALRQEGERLTGSLQGELGTVEISGGSIGADGAFRFTATITLKEGSEEATFMGNLEGNAIRGRVQIVGHTPGNFTGTRPQRGGGAGGPGTPGTRPPSGTPSGTPNGSSK
jgi:imidazolonepropionase-like amidohydrolase